MQGALRLVALVKSEEVARKFLTAMPLPTEVPELHPARPPPGKAEVAGGIRPRVAAKNKWARIEALSHAPSWQNR